MSLNVFIAPSSLTMLYCFLKLHLKFYQKIPKKSIDCVGTYGVEKWSKMNWKFGFTTIVIAKEVRESSLLGPDSTL